MQDEEKIVPKEPSFKQEEEQETFPEMPEALIKNDETDKPKPEKESAKNSK